jgi:5'-nucleotidase
MRWCSSFKALQRFDLKPGAGVGPLTLARQGVELLLGMHVETRIDPRDFPYHWIGFRRGPREQGPESDIDALQAGRIVVTPLRYDRTDEEAYQALAKALPRP